MASPCLSFLSLRAARHSLTSRIHVRIPAIPVSKLVSRPQTRQSEKGNLTSRIPVAVRAKPFRVTSSLVQQRKAVRISRPRPWLETKKSVAVPARTRLPATTLARPQKAPKKVKVPPKAPKEPVLRAVVPTLLPVAVSAPPEEKAKPTKPVKQVRFAEDPVRLGDADEDH
jgi:hypothetical protein